MGDITDRLDTLSKRIHKFEEEYRKHPTPRALENLRVAEKAMNRSHRRRSRRGVLVDLNTAESALDHAFAALS